MKSKERHGTQQLLLPLTVTQCEPIPRASAREAIEVLQEPLLLAARSMAEQSTRERSDEG